PSYRDGLPYVPTTIALPPMVLGGVFELGSTILYSARGIYYHQPGNLVPALLAGFTLINGVAMVVDWELILERKYDIARARGNAAEPRVQAAQAAEKRQAAMAETWTSPVSQPMPAMFKPLLVLPGFHGMALNDVVFNYALSCGPRVLFVHIST